MRQVLQACSGARHRFGLLVAPPCLLRPVYLDYEEDATEAPAFLGGNRIPFTGDVRSPDAWASFFCELSWFYFCNWVKGPGAAMEQHPNWVLWGDKVEQTLYPGEKEVFAARKRLNSFRARDLLNVVKHSMVSNMFTILGPYATFNMLQSFRPGLLQPVSVVTYP